MKTLAKILILFFALLPAGYSQSTFIFFNYLPSSGIDAPVFDAAGNRLFGDNYVAVLYGGPTADGLALASAGLGSMEPVPFIRIYNGQTGYFAMGIFVHLNTVPPSQLAWLQVRAWDLRLGQTYDEVASLGLGGYGASALFQARGGELNPTGLPPQPLLGLQSFSLVPEPGTWATAGVGCWRVALEVSAILQATGLMKQYSLSILLLTLASTAFGQGTFIFRNYVSSVNLDAPVFDESGNRLSGAHYVAVLYGGATPDSMAIAMVGAQDMPPESLTAVFNGQPGYFARGGRVIVPTAPSGGLAWLQVRVWDLRLGQTYDDVVSLGLGYGASSLFQAVGGDIEATGRPPQPLTGLESFSLVPEPGTWALSALGGGIALWCWRRKAR